MRRFVLFCYDTLDCFNRLSNRNFDNFLVHNRIHENAFECFFIRNVKEFVDPVSNGGIYRLVTVICAYLKRKIPRMEFLDIGVELLFPCSWVKSVTGRLHFDMEDAIFALRNYISFGCIGRSWHWRLLACWRNLLFWWSLLRRLLACWRRLDRRLAGNFLRLLVC